MLKKLVKLTLLLTIIWIMPIHAKETQTMISGDQIHLSNLQEDAVVVVQAYNQQAYEQEIEAFYKSLHTKTLPEKIENAARFFLNQPYFLEPLGEGLSAKYSQEPLFRTDQFDCVSYVDTVLSLVKSPDFSHFKNNLLAIRYANREPLYENRTDWFTDLEWLPTAEKLGWLHDVTDKIVDQNNRRIAKMAQTLIDKPNWYLVRPLKALHLLEPLPNKEKTQELIASLRAKHKYFKPQISKLSYLPLDKLFTNGKANEYIFNQIPSGSVIAIVRPDWPIRDEFPGFPQGYGTNLNVSHLGIVVRTKEGLMFFNASSVYHKVIAIPLSEYLQKYLDSPTIKGIHVEQIV